MLEAHPASATGDRGAERAAPSKPRDEALDATKGVLILLIVLGHNLVLMGLLPGLRWFLYNWHVYSFFLISALIPITSTKAGFMADRLVRYGVPFVIFSSVAWLVAGGWGTPVQKVGDWLLAIAIGSADLLDRASGARLYWFLPALLGLTLIRWLIARTRSWETPVLLGVATAGFLFSGFIPPAVSAYVPLGLPIALYILGPCIAFFYLYRLVADRDFIGKAIAAAVLLAVFSLCTYATYRNGTSLILASFDYYDLREFVPLALHATIPVMACGLLVVFLSLAPASRFLVWVGRNSLVIYLVHQFIYHALSLLLKRVWAALGIESDVLTGLALLLSTVVLSLAFAKAVLSSPLLRRWLTPRNLAEWRETLGLHRLASGQVV